jgi:hypothetical protein
MLKWSLLVALQIIFQATASAQNFVPFVNPGLQSEVMDMKLNAPSKKFATLELNGNVSIYDLTTRRLQLSIPVNHEVLNEGGVFNYRNLMQFNRDASILALFTVDYGARIYDVNSGNILMDMSWEVKDKNSIKPDYTLIKPLDIRIFDNRYVLFFYDGSDLDNNAFLFDLQTMQQVVIDTDNGFRANEIVTNEKDSAYALSIQPVKKAVGISITWPVRPARKVKNIISKIGRKEDNYYISFSNGLVNKISHQDFELLEESPGSFSTSNTWKDSLSRAASEKLVDDYVSNHAYYKLFTDFKAKWTQTDTIEQTTFSWYELNEYYKYVQVADLRSGVIKQRLFYRSSHEYSKVKYMVLPGTDEAKLELEFVLAKRTKDSLVLFRPVQQREFIDEWRSTIIESPDGNYIVYPLYSSRKGVRHFELRVLNIHTGNVNVILDLPAKGIKIQDGWIREDILGSVPQLNRYRFLQNGYFMVQGNAYDLPINTMVFETRFWTKLLDIPNKHTVHANNRPLKTLLAVGDEVLMNNNKVWNYKENLFAASNGDFEPFEPLSEDSVSMKFMDKINVNHHIRDTTNKTDQEIIYLNDSVEVIRVDYDNDHRKKFTHQNGNLTAEYYPKITWLDAQSNHQYVTNINAYADAELSQHVRLTAGDGKKYILRSPYGPSGATIKAAFSRDRRYVFTASNYNFIDVWHTADGSYLGTVFPLKDNKALILDSANYFYAQSREAMKDLYVRHGELVYSVEDLDRYLNRPDKVLQSMSFIENPELLELYKKLLERRTILYGKDTIASRPYRPYVTLNKTALPLATDKPLLEVSFTTHSKQILSKGYIWMNNILTDSFSINQPSGEIKYTVRLQNGSNKIQIEVVNESGVHSFKETYYVNYVPANSESTSVQALLMAVNDYSLAGLDLKYPVKDSKDLDSALKVATRAVTNTLFDSQVSLENFKSAAKNFKETSIDDMVVLYLSGHGTLNNDGEFIYCTASTDPSAPGENGISMSELQSFFKNIPARRRLMILDACHSGNVNLIAYSKAQDSSGLLSNGQSITGKGVAEIMQPTETISARNYNEILDQQLLEVAGASGVQVFAGTSGNSVAVESDKWQNGVFTYYLVKCLKDPAVADIDIDGVLSFAEMSEYVKANVTRETNGLQTPQALKVTWDGGLEIIRFR